MKTNPSFHSASSVAAKACILLAAVFALWPSLVEAECHGDWDVSNGWRIKQGKTNVDLDLRQNGGFVTGTARYEGVIKKGAFGTIRGTVISGRVRGALFILRIHWSNNNTIGVYNGIIGPTGRIEGTVYDQANPGSSENWYSDTHMPCVQSTPPPQLPPPQPITDNIKRGSFVILQSLPQENRYASIDLVLGQKYEVLGRRGGTLTIRGSGGRPHMLSVSSVQLAP